jgi:hypothetical protein
LNAISASIPALSWVTVVSVYLWWTGLGFFSGNTEDVILLGVGHVLSVWSFRFVGGIVQYWLAHSYWQLGGL